MVARTLRVATLLATAASSSMLLGGVDALPQARPETVEVRDHHHHHHHHHNDHHRHDHGWDSSRTKVYADDPLIVSGDGNHVHAHLDKRRHRHHGSHHGHHETKVHADDPLIISGNGNHVHAHSHKRGLVDPLVPLLGAVPGLPGIIDLVNVVSHTVLSEKLASLIISPRPAGASAQSTDSSGNSGFVISASNTSSSVMYLLPQDVSSSLAPPKKLVLITMPMFHEKEKGLKMYCASYDPSPSAPIQISSEPCLTASMTPNSNSTTPHTSQLFSWDQQSGEIVPLWNKDATQPLVDTTSAPGGGPDPAGQVKGDGFVVGQSVAPAGDSQASSGKVVMVFHAVEAQTSNSSGIVNGAEASPTSTSAASSPTVAALEATSTQPAAETVSASTVGAISSAVS